MSEFAGTYNLNQAKDVVKQMKIKLASTIAGMKTLKVEDIQKGEFVIRSMNAKKVYTRGSYCRENGKYELNDVSDISRFIYVNKGTILITDFDF